MKGDVRSPLSSAPPGEASARWVVRWLRRTIKIVTALLLGLWLLYVVAINGFLLLGGVDRLLASTEDVKITFSVAWSLWPGRMHAKDLRVRGQDHNVQWVLEMDRADATVALSELIHKRFHVTKVRGEGASFIFRNRVERDRVSDPTTQLLPHIPGFADPPILEPRPPPSDPTELWTVHIENVDVPVRTLWFQQFRYQGSGRARGKFRLRPALHLWVGPASLDLDPGRLEVGGTRVVDAFSGHIECLVDPFDTRVPVERQVFRFISATIELEGRGLTLDPLDAFLPPDAHLSTRGGTLLVSARADHGVFTEKSRFEMRSEHVDFERETWKARGENAVLEMTGQPRAKGRIRFSLERGAFAEPEAAEPALEIEKSMVSAVSSSADTSVEWAVEGGSLETERAIARDLRRFNRALRSSGWKFGGGSASASARVSYEKQVANGSVVIDLDKARAASREGLDLGLDAHAALDIANFQPKRRTGNVALRLEGKRIVLSEPARELGASGAHITAHGHFVEGRGRGDLHAKIDTLAARAGTTRLTSRAELDLALTTEDANRGVGELVASGELSDLRAAFGPKLRAHVDSASLATRIKTRQNDLPEGFLSLSAKNLSAMEVSELRECHWAAADGLALYAELGPDHAGRERLAVRAGLDNARSRWGDFAADASPRLAADVDARLLKGQSGPVFFDLDAENIVLKSGAGRPKGWDARIPALRLNAVLAGKADDLSGRVAIVSRHTTARLGDTPVHADLVVKADVTRIDPAARQAIGSLDLSIEHAGLTTTSVTIDDWWAKARISSMRVGVSENLDLWGKFSAKLRDGQPGLALFADERGLPDWIVRAFPLRDLEASGEFFRHCQLTDLDFNHVSGGPLVGKARIQSVPDQVRAAAVLRLESLQPISAGLALSDGKPSIRPLAGEGWLAEQDVILDQAAGMTLFGPCKKPPKKCEF